MYEKNMRKINSAKFLESINNNNRSIINLYKSWPACFSVNLDRIAEYLDAWNFIKKRLQYRYFPGNFA